MILPTGRPRLIPAHAGKTAQRLSGTSPARAHPRSREENDVHAEASIRFEGSSPLTRGKLACFGRADAFPGLIPTHAGKTELPRSAGSHHRAHPRSCRENRTGVFQDIPEHGSSPLMRGKRDVPRGQVEALGRIPAHAGKTTSARRVSRSPRAHPRSRGEN